MGEQAVELTEEEEQLYLKVGRDFWAYCCRCVRTFDESKPHLPSRPFPQWPFLRGLAKDLQAGKGLLVLKSRQMFLTWLLCAYISWLLLFQRRVRVLVVSKREKDAHHLADRVRAILENLPPEISEYCDVRNTDNKGEVQMHGGSSAMFLPAAPGIGRTFTASVVVLDELAFHPHAEDMYTGLSPTLAGGGTLVGLSSPNGVGNLFHRLCRTAKERGAVLRRVHWTQHPERDQAWYDRVVKDLTKRQAAQEYDCAFIQSGAAVFDQEYLKVVGPPPSREQILLWRNIAASNGVQTPFVMGGDVGEGLEEGDRSTLTVLHRETGRQVYTLAGRWRPDVFAQKVAQVARVFSGVIGIERNGPGGTVILKLEEMGLGGRLYHHREWDERGPKKLRPGWATTAKSKPVMIDELEIALRTGQVQLTDEATVDELMVYEYGTGSEHSGAPSGFHDDRVIALAVAWQMRKAASSGLTTTG